MSANDDAREKLRKFYESGEEMSGAEYNQLTKVAQAETENEALDRKCREQSPELYKSWQRRRLTHLELDSETVERRENENGDTEEEFKNASESLRKSWKERGLE